MAGVSSFAVSPTPATVHETVSWLGDGRISAVELCQDLLQRRRDVDGVINGFLHVDEEDVLAQARAADDRRSKGAARSDLDGVPIAIKDNLAVQGQRCRCASRILEGYTATYDATVIAKMKAAGIICFGRTNMDEFAMGSSTEHSAYGVTRNPWNSECVPGGSSGGSAAVVASGQALAALGSDTGGSIRLPASFCGLVGLKPTYGLVSRFGLVAFASSLDQIGPLTRDVRDAAMLMDVIAGHDPRDSTSLAGTVTDFATTLDETPTLTVGLPREFYEVDGLAPAIRQQLERAMAAFRAVGARIVDVSIPHTQYAVASYYIIATAEASSNLARYDGVRYGQRDPKATELTEMYRQTRESGFGAEVKRRILLGTYVLSSGYYDAYYLRAQKVRTLIRNDFATAFAACDILLTPVSPTPAFPIGSVSDPLQMYLADICTIPVNLAGVCAISIPAGVDDGGLPVGIQLIGASLQDRKLLTAGHWLQQQLA